MNLNEIKKAVNTMFGGQFLRSGNWERLEQCAFCIMPTVKVQILSVGSFYCYLTDNIRPRWVLYGGCLEHLNERLTEDSKHLEKVVQVLPENFAPTPRETVTKFFAVI